MSTVARALPTQLPDVSLPFTHSTLKDVTVFAEPNNSAFAEQLPTTPLVGAQLSHRAHKDRLTTPLLVSADVLKQLHAVVAWFGTQPNASVWLIQTPGAYPTCTDSIGPGVTVFVSLNNNACVVLQLSMQPVDALHSNRVQHHRPSIRTRAHADAHQLNNAVADLCSIQTDALVLLIQMLDVCPTFTDSTLPDVTVSA